MKKKWIIKTKLKAGSQKLKIEKIRKILLENRGLKTKNQIAEFLNPSNPYNLDIKRLGIKKNEVNQVIKRIKKAIIDKEKIIIYGDYDADGICATAILWETLYSLGAQAMPFIPNREKHGYGLNKKGIDDICQNSKFKIQNSKFLLITVDNGITAHKAVNYAEKKGIEVIITDHHQKKVKSKGKYDLPKVKSIIWSDKICGAGVAWFLAREIYHHFHKTLKGFKASNALELACIGTITDLMPVLEVNRSLIKYGLAELRKSQRPGIKALCSKAGISQDKIRTYEIGYLIGPRLNAMGRLGNALESLRLLCTKKNLKADGLAAKLGITNLKRQQLTKTNFEHARSLWLKSLGIKKKGFNLNGPIGTLGLNKLKKKRIIFLSHKSYNPGVIGLIAGRLVEEFYRPAVVISEGKNYSKGSVRSIKGFNIIKALRQLDNVFEDLGGHPMAAGFTIKTNKIKELKNKLELLSKKEIKKELLQPTIKVDLEIILADISWQIENQIEKFAPFGIGNSRPVFVSRNVEVINVRAVGRERKHLKLKLKSQISSLKKQDNKITIFDGIAFNMGKLADKIFPRQAIDICYSLDKNVWNGNENLELKIKDIK